jgi:citrate synthase
MAANEPPARPPEATLATRKGKTIAMNIDGATAVIYAELGIPASRARGLFCTAAAASD